jgi:cysteinyl-tRNA synthetase
MRSRGRAASFLPPVLLALGLAVGSSGCGPVPLQRLGGYVCVPCTDLAAPAVNAFTAATLAGTKWLYQLQGATAEGIRATGFDIVVMDYSGDGSEDGRYSAAEMAEIQNDGIAREALAYLSIGEAEDYRYYFDPGWVYPFGGQPNGSAPCWLARTNPDWAGNYKVQYWSDAWQQVILGYLDRIIDDGFDGIYLDIIDAFEYWGDSDNGEGYFLSEEEAAVRMINFVKRIAHHARTVRGKADFRIIPQNGERILDYDTGLQYLGAGDYRATISGLGIEDLYFMETSPIPAGETAERKTYLDAITDAGKQVLVVDYVDDGSRPVDSVVTQFRTLALGDGYLPYAAQTNRELDEINTFTGQP